MSNEPINKVNNEQSLREKLKHKMTSEVPDLNFTSNLGTISSSKIANSTINQEKDISNMIKNFAKEISPSVKISRRLSMQPIKNSLIINNLAPLKKEKRKSVLDIDFLDAKPKKINGKKK